VSSGRIDLELEHDVGRLSLPLVVIDLDTLAVRAVTVAATKLVGRSADAIIGRPVFELLPASERQDAELALAALRDGHIDFFNTRRKFDTSWAAEGTTLWVRALRFGDQRVALSEISQGHQQRQSALVEYFGREPTDMAVGTIDADWTFTSVSADVETVLGIRAEDLIGRSISTVVVADEDIARLFAAAAQVRAGSSVALQIVMRSTSSSSRTVSFVLTALAGSTTRGFIITEDPRHIDDARAARLSALERHLWNIAAEVDASGILQFVGVDPNPVRFPQLRTLTTRQWEILSRLMRGERVPTIAKELFISQSTVRNHLSVIFERFGVHSQPQLLALLNEMDSAPAPRDGLSM
jgi:DNA-binding NarL/FixJ family response regulator